MQLASDGGQRDRDGAAIDAVDAAGQDEQGDRDDAHGGPNADGKTVVLCQKQRKSPPEATRRGFRRQAMSGRMSGRGG
jgi:hypothetical protein